METMNPRYHHLMRRHSYGKGQYTIGSELSPLALLSTDKPIKVFIDGEVYALPPTKYKPVVNGKYMVQRPKCKAEINIIKRYNRLHPDMAPLSTYSGPIRKVIDEYTPMYYAILRTDLLTRFNRAECAHRIYEHINKYIPSHSSVFNYENIVDSNYIKDVIVKNECGTYYSVLFGRSGYYIIRPMIYNKKLNEYVTNSNIHLFKSITYEGVLSWFLGMYYERIKKVSRKGVTSEFAWYANSDRGGGTIKKLSELDNDHLYNISRWICTKLVLAEDNYIQMYSIDLIETVNALLVNRIHQEEINRCCLGQLK